MNISDLSIPSVYLDSQDFRFFLSWFDACLEKVIYDTDNFFDLYDPLKCPSEILWALADTMGYKYDDRLPVSFNRLVLLYFMSMIYNRGSKDGVTLAAEVNLAQRMLLDKAQGYIDGDGNEVPGVEILYDRLEDTSIPVNSVYVTSHSEDGYVDVVYFSDKKPIDACLEYVRPVGMYLFQYAGVRYDSRTKISVDARLTNSKDIGISIGPTHVGHYRREDYARLQKTVTTTSVDTSHTREPVWYRNSEFEGEPDPNINPGYRAVYSLQLSNNEEVVRSLIGPIFDIGFGPQNVTDDDKYPDNPEWNLRYNKSLEATLGSEIHTIDDDRTTDRVNPRPAVNPIMKTMGDAISLNEDNTEYSGGDVTYWAKVQEIVRAGRADEVFNIGDQFTVMKGTTPLVFDVIGIDHDIPTDSTKTHSMTLQLHDCLMNLQFDAPEKNNPNLSRRSFGSNNWLESALRQWLNAIGGDWWSAKTEYDVAPEYAATTAGFLSDIDSEFLSVIGNVKKITTKNTITDGGGSVDSDEKIFLLSRSEVYGGNENSINEGMAYPYYSDNSSLPSAGTGADVNRIKYLSGVARHWWLRSPCTFRTEEVRSVFPDGTIGRYAALNSNSNGVAPACCII